MPEKTADPSWKPLNQKSSPNTSTEQQPLSLSLFILIMLLNHSSIIEASSFPSSTLELLKRVPGCQRNPTPSKPIRVTPCSGYTEAGLRLRFESWGGRVLLRALSVLKPLMCCVLGSLEAARKMNQGLGFRAWCEFLHVWPQNPQLQTESPKYLDWILRVLELHTGTVLGSPTQRFRVSVFYFFAGLKAQTLPSHSRPFKTSQSHAKSGRIR